MPAYTPFWSVRVPTSVRPFGPSTLTAAPLPGTPSRMNNVTAGDAIRYRVGEVFQADGQSAPRSVSSELSRRQHG